MSAGATTTTVTTTTITTVVLLLAALCLLSFIESTVVKQYYNDMFRPVLPCCAFRDPPVNPLKRAHPARGASLYTGSTTVVVVEPSSMNVPL